MVQKCDGQGGAATGATGQVVKCIFVLFEAGTIKRVTCMAVAGELMFCFMI